MRYFTIMIGLLLIFGALLLTPPVHDLAGASITSVLMRIIAWSLAALVFLIGSGLILFRRRLSGVNLLLLVISIIVSLLIAEGMLALVGFTSPYHIVLNVPEIADWATVNSETGLRIVPDKYWHPKWPITPQGFAGTAIFEAIEPEDYDVRVLFLGDSFTFGINASAYENSFVSRIEESLQRETHALVWNTAIPGIGQPQQWDSLQRYFPLLQPQVVVLGFCTNDFYDNQYPLDAFYVFQSGKWIVGYDTDVNGKLYRLNAEQAYRRAFQAAERPIEYVASCRVGYLTLRAFERLLHSFRVCSDEYLDTHNPNKENERCPGYADTRHYLRKIRDYVAERGAALLLIPIPFTADLKTPTTCYKSIFELCSELDIPYIEVRQELVLEDYFLPPDDHWNDSGHAVVAKTVLPRLYEMLAEQGAVPSGK